MSVPARPVPVWAALAGCLLALAVVAAASLLLGSGPAGPREVLASLRGGGAEYDWIVFGYRLPRTLLGLLVGAALGVAGLFMQALTRNPLADPGLLGVNAGAAAAVASAIAFLGVSDPRGYVWFAFAGAAVVAAAGYVIGSQGRVAPTPERLVLAGAALSAVLVAYTSTIVLGSEETFDDFRFWQVGSLAGRDLDTVRQLLPFVLAGLAAAALLARALNAVALGEETGRALGVRVGRVKLAAALTVTVLCGAATAAAGPIGFVGLAVPYVARMIAGVDLRRLVPLSMLLGAVVVLGSDVVGRLVAGQGELETGIVTAVVGAPVFVALVRRRRLVRL